MADMEESVGNEDTTHNIHQMEGRETNGHNTGYFNQISNNAHYYSTNKAITINTTFIFKFNLV